MTTPDELLSIATPDPFGPFQLDEEPLEPSGIVVTVSGELDMASAPRLRASLSAAVDSGAGGLVLDLRPVGFLDSVALATILWARRQLKERPMAIVIARDSYSRLIFEVAGLPQCLDLFETRAEAVAHVTG